MSDSHTGLTHSEETRAQMSDSQKLVDRSGANHPMYGKVPANAFQSGYAANNPMYGKVPANAFQSGYAALNPMYGKSGALNPMYDKTPTPETRAQMSYSKSGALNPMFGRTGPNHPMYGKVAANAMTINVYDIDNVFVRSFPTQVAAAEWLNTTQTQVSRYIKSGIP